MRGFVYTMLDKLAVLIREDRFEDLESEALEIKPVPPSGADWRERHKSVNAFLNSRGGVLVLGIKEEGRGAEKRYVFTGYRAEAEEKLKEFPQLFTDRQGTKLDLRQWIPDMQLRNFLDGRVAVVFVDELPADQKYVFYRGEAWRRVLTGDHKLIESEIESQEEYREEALQARELQPIPDASPEDLDLDQINEYIQQLNRPVRIETMKTDLESARPFLERKSFIRDGKVTTLGMLVCGRHPEDSLGFRCHVHGYVDVPQEIAQDKQDLVGNILPLMQNSLAYVLRNIQVGISLERGGTATPQYPEEVLRETVNNALAHRDYSINKQAIITIHPGDHISIRNPGRFRKPLLIDYPDDQIPVRRIIPEAKARNPKLADVLRVFRKWEGRGIGMATLVNLALENRIDLSTYRLYTEEVCLVLKSGPLLDEHMKTRLQSYDAFIELKLGAPLNEEQTLVLTYIMKAEWANSRHQYSILLTADNNHFEQLQKLERSGLISKHERSTSFHPVYIAHRVLMQEDYRDELAAIYGETLAALDTTSRECLQFLYRHDQYSHSKAVTAKMAAFSIWHAQKGEHQNIREFDLFYRKVRYAFNKLSGAGFIVRADGKGYHLNRSYSADRLL